MTATQTQTEVKFGLVGPDTGGIRWYGSAEEVAAVWHSREFHNPVLRVFRNGKLGFGTSAEVAPVYAELNRLREEEAESA